MQFFAWSVHFNKANYLPQVLGETMPVERYLRGHSKPQFSHGICPECAEKHYPDLIFMTNDLTTPFAYHCATFAALRY